MFNLFKKKEERTILELPPLTGEAGKQFICAPAAGEAVLCTQISDLTFQKEMLGKGMAIKPSEGKLYAPADGKIEMLIESLHALTMTTEEGAELLIHIGIDTVALKGKYFKSYVKEGSFVKRGELLIEFNIEEIQAAGYDTIVPVIICNSDEYTEVERLTGQQVEVGEVIMKLKKAN